MSAFSRVRRRGRVTFPAPRGAAATLFTAFALAGCVGAGFAAERSLNAAPTMDAPKIAMGAKPALAPDVVSPTGHDVRGEDVYGAGAFGASRGGGARRHRGADYIAEPGEIVRAPIAGVVERIGFAYRGDDRYRYVEVADADTQRAVRVLYVGPLVQLGAVVRAGDPIGRAQDLSGRYPRGITNHVHVELRDNGVIEDPARPLAHAARSDVDLGMTTPHLNLRSET